MFLISFPPFDSSKKRNVLFKFDNSSHAAMEMMKENVTVGIDNLSIDGHKKFSQMKKRNKHLVCAPTPNNITIIFKPVVKFIEEIEQELGYKPG